MQKPVLAVVGPTASGKTSLAIKISQKLGGEIISCDSMQIYKGMNIGTAKPTPSELSSVPHHLIGFLDYKNRFSVSDYVELADNKIAELQNNGKVPVITGGTGLYARSLLYGIQFNDMSRSDEIRMELQKDVSQGKINELYARLTELDPRAVEAIHINNEKRVVRALEYCMTTGKKISEQCTVSEPKYPYCMICLGFRDRANLYERINKRVDLMISSGLVDEAKEFFSNNPLGSTAAQAIGYKELFPYFSGDITLEEATENIKRETRRYAKRQLTWFKREKNTDWLFVDDYNNSDELLSAAIKIISESHLFNI